MAAPTAVDESRLINDLGGGSAARPAGLTMRTMLLNIAAYHFTPIQNPQDHAAQLRTPDEALDLFDSLANDPKLDRKVALKILPAVSHESITVGPCKKLHRGLV